MKGELNRYVIVSVFFISLEINNYIMKKYKVIKPFFKLSEQKNYVIGDTIELSDSDAKTMNWYVVEVKKEKTK